MKKKFKKIKKISTIKKSRMFKNKILRNLKTKDCLELEVKKL